MSGIASVASFFVSRVDTKVDARLPEDSPLRGKVAIANARMAYKLFKEIFSGPRWERLAAAGARVQRPLWASTGTKNPAYSDVLYVDELVAPHTVNTMPEATLQAFLDHGRARPTVEAGFAAAEETLQQAAAAGIDLEAVTSELLEEGLASFAKDFARLLEEIEKRLGVRTTRARHGGNLDGLSDAVIGRLESFRKEAVVRRVWAGDHTLWKPQPDGITDRLGWLNVIDPMMEETDRLRGFAREVAADGCETAVLLGMGGSSLAPEVLSSTFGTAPGALKLQVLDTTDPATIRAVEETCRSAKDALHRRQQVRHDDRDALAARLLLGEAARRRPLHRHHGRRARRSSALARERGFRTAFLNPPDIGGRYSALSYFGLVPAALIGVDLDQLLDRGARDAARLPPQRAGRGEPGRAGWAPSLGEARASPAATS